MDKIRVLLVDDDPVLTNGIGNFINRRPDMETVGCISDGAEVMSAVRSAIPDVIVMDLILPHRDGFTLLEQLQTLEEISRPRVIVLTGLARDEFILRAVALGAAYFMVKPFDMQILCDRIAETAPGRVNAAEAMPEMRIEAERSDDLVTDLFLTLGIPAHIKGYAYLREAVHMVMEDHTLISCMTKQLYPGVAKRFSTSASKVERAMRHAIEVAWSRGRLETVNRMYGCRVFEKRDKPTNGEFIALVADKVGMRMSA